MNNLFDDNTSEASHTTFRDLIMLMLLVVFGMLILVILLVNPPGNDNTDDVRLPGEIIVEMTWPRHNPVDMDLWVLDPYDTVGHTNRQGYISQYLLDTRGTFPTNHHLELTSINKKEDGHYIINAHLYSLGEGNVPVEVSFKIAERQNGQLVTIYSTTLTFTREYEENTVLRFDIINGNIENNSTENVSILPPLEFTYE